MKVPIDRIIVGERIRKNINWEKVKQYSESIKITGLIQPICVAFTEEEGGYYKLVAGYHRLEATKANGETEIEAIIIQETNPLILEMAEIDENLMRNELHWLERGAHMARRKEIYEQLYPQTIPRNKSGYTATSEIISFEPKPFTEDVAQKLNVSQRTVQNEIQIAQNLIPEVKELVREKDIGKVDALKMARMDPDEQKKVAEKIAVEGYPNVKTAINDLQKEGYLKADEDKEQKNPELSMSEDVKSLLHSARNMQKQLKVVLYEVPQKNNTYIIDFIKAVQKDLQHALNYLEENTS